MQQMDLKHARAQTDAHRHTLAKSGNTEKPSNTANL